MPPATTVLLPQLLLCAAIKTQEVDAAELHDRLRRYTHEPHKARLQYAAAEAAFRIAESRTTTHELALRLALRACPTEADEAGRNAMMARHFLDALVRTQAKTTAKDLANWRVPHANIYMVLAARDPRSHTAGLLAFVTEPTTILHRRIAIALLRDIEAPALATTLCGAVAKAEVALRLKVTDRSTGSEPVAVARKWNAPLQRISLRREQGMPLVPTYTIREVGYDKKGPEVLGERFYYLRAVTGRRDSGYNEVIAAPLGNSRFTKVVDADAAHLTAELRRIAKFEPPLPTASTTTILVEPREDPKSKIEQALAGFRRQAKEARCALADRLVDLGLVTPEAAAPLRGEVEVALDYDDARENKAIALPFLADVRWLERDESKRLWR